MNDMLIERASETSQSPRRRDMYVCLCNGVSDKQIVEAVSKGATDINMLSEKLNVGTQCGKCKVYATQILEEAKASLSCPQPGSAPASQTHRSQSDQTPT